MSNYLIGSIPILSGTLELPLCGAWTAQVEADSDEQPEPAATLTIDGREFVGTVAWGSSVHGRIGAMVVGGAGALSKPTTTRFYHNVPARIPVLDLILEHGERLAHPTDPALDLHLDAWIRAAVAAGTELQALAQHALGGNWRVLPDGSIWVGRETWPTVDVEVEVLRERPEDRAIVLGAGALEVVPGCTFLGKHIVRVTHFFEPDFAETEVRYA